MRVESNQKVEKNVDADLFLPDCRKIELLMRAHMNIRSIFENEEACQKRVRASSFGKRSPFFSSFLFLSLFLRFPACVRGGGQFPSSSWTITTWPSPAFSIVNLLHESGRSHNSRPIDSDRRPVSLKEKNQPHGHRLAHKTWRNDGSRKSPEPKKETTHAKNFPFYSSFK